MKKKNFKGKLNLSKKTISNLDKSGIVGGTNLSANSNCGVECLVSAECNPTLVSVPPQCGNGTLIGETCVGLSCEGFTCPGNLECPTYECDLDPC